MPTSWDDLMNFCGTWPAHQCSAAALLYLWNCLLHHHPDDDEGTMVVVRGDDGSEQAANLGYDHHIVMQLRAFVGRNSNSCLINGQWSGLAMFANPCRSYDFDKWINCCMDWTREYTWRKEVSFNDTVHRREMNFWLLKALEPFLYSILLLRGTTFFINNSTICFKYIVQQFYESDN